MISYKLYTKKVPYLNYPRLNNRFLEISLNILGILNDLDIQ